MNEVQLFNFENQEVRTVLINNEPYFIGKDVAGVLGYERPDNAIRNHVDEDDKLMHQISASGQSRKMTVINESGLYSLILSSKLPNAKKFKHWVTGEVLPSIRKTGGYQVPANPMQALELMFQVQKEINTKVDAVNDDLQEFKKDMPLLGVEESKVTVAVRKKGVNCLGGKESNAYQDKSVRGKVYADIYRELKRQFGVASYKAIKRNQVNTAIQVIDGYTLPLMLKETINILNGQERLCYE